MQAIILIHDADMAIIDCVDSEQLEKNIASIKGCLSNKESSDYATLFSRRKKILLPRKRLLNCWIIQNDNYMLGKNEENNIL